MNSSQQREGTLAPGEHVGSYRVLRELGEGGMATVYEAIHEHIEQHAAIKVLKPEFSRNAQMATRFVNEARAVNIVRHPGLVSIFEFGKLPDGSAYIVMEYLDGESLAARLKRLGSLPLPTVLRLGRQMASAVAAAHDKGIIHRDLKPANVMIVPDSDMAGGERTKILDFGIAKVALQPPPGVAPEAQPTVAGALLGTPAYMAPEQCRGAGSVTGRADVYSLGVMLYQMLAGRLPFISQAPVDLLGMHMYQTPPPLRQVAPAVPAEVAALVDATLLKDPERRPGMAQVATELDRLGAASAVTPRPPLPDTLSQTYGQATPGPGRRRLLMVALGVVVGLLALIVWGVQTRRPPPVLQPVVVDAGAPPPARPDLLTAAPDLAAPAADLAAPASRRVETPRRRHGTGKHVPEEGQESGQNPEPQDQTPTYRGTRPPIDTTFPGPKGK